MKKESTVINYSKISRFFSLIPIPLSIQEQINAEQTPSAPQKMKYFSKGKVRQ